MYSDESILELYDHNLESVKGKRKCHQHKLV